MTIILKNECKFGTKQLLNLMEYAWGGYSPEQGGGGQEGGHKFQNFTVTYLEKQSYLQLKTGEWEGGVNEGGEMKVQGSKLGEGEKK